MHIVQRGESLYQIAEKFYGAGAPWTRIRDFNGGRIAADGMVREGVTIRIPGVAAPEVAPARAAPAVRPGGAAPGPERMYTVRKNDTLGEIAQQLLGSARRRAEIVELNRDKIADENEIRVGMVLAIPAG
jgi:nucleoid-associated protein YgaU